MYSSFFLTILVSAVGFFALHRKFRFEQENKEDDSPSPSPSPPHSPSSSSSSSSSFSSSSSSSSLRLASPSRSPSLSHNWTIDVFPSFHGQDVRNGLLSHVQKEFMRNGIRQFKDTEMERGESISFQLVRAIRGSKIAIVFFSRNYASSTWCLDELVEIMNWRRDFGQIVLPIFYQIDPSDVRKQTGSFGKVFRKTCAGKTKKKIRRWRVALEEVASIAGFHSTNWNTEPAMIEDIGTDVSKKLITLSFGRWRIALEEVNRFAGYHSSNWDNEAGKLTTLSTRLTAQLPDYYLLGRPWIGMTQLVVVYGKWVLKNLAWHFDVDNLKGCRMFFLRDDCTHCELLDMAHDDFGLDKETHVIEVSYSLPDTILQEMPADTPPTYVINDRQVWSLIQLSKKHVIRLCVSSRSLYV